MRLDSHKPIPRSDFQGLNKRDHEPQNKKAIQRHWFGKLDEETQERYEDEMINSKFEESHPSHEDKMRAKRDWESVIITERLK